MFYYCLNSGGMGALANGDRSATLFGVCVIQVVSVFNSKFSIPQTKESISEVGLDQLDALSE